jgi:hypothetical protein
MMFDFLRIKENVYEVFVVSPALKLIQKDLPGMAEIMKDLNITKPSFRRRLKVAWRVLWRKEYLITYRQMNTMLSIMQSIKSQMDQRRDTVMFDKTLMSLAEEIDSIDFQAPAEAAPVETKKPPLLEKCNFCLQEVLMPCRSTRDLEYYACTTIRKGEHCFEMLHKIGGGEQGLDYVNLNRAALLHVPVEVLLQALKLEMEKSNG